MAKLPMVQRLAVLAAFQASVAIAYFSIIERSRAREGSFERDGYNFWDMYGEPKHKRDQKANAKKSES
ncbi:hypothetical protein KC19_4G085400 [Ceratodon purpureus]|uniref:Uncharacterized protein n=1 Tax=Ceratodon purpureus TaxID=3225 RepID=A0A8T0I943_CERPU|nr:hypothetical protein KC19_4G085400 [Ceratodon purpureus]